MERQIYECIRTFVHFFIRSFIHSFIHAFIHPSIPCMQSFIHAFIHSFVCSFIHSFNHSIISIVQSFNQSFIHSFIHTHISISLSIYSYLSIYIYIYVYIYIYIYTCTECVRRCRGLTNQAAGLQSDIDPENGLPPPPKKQSHWLDASSKLLMGEDVVLGPAVMWLGKFRVWCSTDGIHTTWFR